MPHDETRAAAHACEEAADAGGASAVPAFAPDASLQCPVPFAALFDGGSASRAALAASAQAVWARSSALFSALPDLPADGADAAAAALWLEAPAQSRARPLLWFFGASRAWFRARAQ